MSEDRNSTQSPKPVGSMGAQGIIFAIVAAACGIFTATRLASVFPLWAALPGTLIIWLVLVVCLTACCGPELLDIIVGSVTIVIVMTVVLEAGVRLWQRRHPKPPIPTVNNVRDGADSSTVRGPMSKPKLMAIDHDDDYHASHVGRLPDGRQLFLTTPFIADKDSIRTVHRTS